MALKLLANYFSYNGSEFSSCCLHIDKISSQER